MKKVKGKALSLVLSLALVISSFSMLPVSAASHSEKATSITGGIADQYLVNGGSAPEGGSDTLSISGIATSASLETERHKTVDADLVALSHSSGSSLVKWNDFEEDGALTLTLRSKSVKGTETLKALYKGTYQDEDDNDVTVSYTDTFTVTVFDNNSVVVGVAGTPAPGTDATLDRDFAQKTLAHELDAVNGVLDNETLTVYQARLGTTDAEVNWAPLKTVVKPDSGKVSDDVKAYYTLKSSSEKNIALTDGGTPESTTYGLTAPVAATETTPGIAISNDGKKLTFTAPTDGTTTLFKYTIAAGATQTENVTEGTSVDVVLATAPADEAAIVVTAYTDADNANGTAATGNVAKTTTPAVPGSSVNATVAPNAAVGSVTLTAEITDYGKKANTDGDGYTPPTDQSSVKAKTSVTKTIKVDTSVNSGYTKFGKYKGYNYLYKTSLDDTATPKVKVTGYEVNFADKSDEVTVADKASVDEITGSVTSIDITEGSVTKTDLTKGSVTVTGDKAKAGDIITDNGTVEVSGKASVGNISGDDVSKATISGSKAGNVTATEVEINAEDEESSTTVGDVTAGKVTVNSVDSKGVTIGTIKASAADTEISLSGNDIKVGGVDFDYYNASLKFDDFQGAIPAPKHADVEGAQIVTNNTEDKVEITGDVDVDAVSVTDESQITFDGKATIATIDGAGTIVISAGKLDGLTSVSGTILKLADANITSGLKVFTAVSDSVDEDDFDTYGFTLKKDAGKTVDNFLVDKAEFKGLTINGDSTRIAKGYTQTFTWSTYAPGTSLPEGYSVKWNLDADDSIMTGTANDNGSFTVTVADVDPDFSSENKGVLTAYVVDEDGDEDDDYTVGEADLTAIAVPDAAYKSDTSAKDMKIGETYRFRITSVAGTQPTNFVVASGAAAVSYYGNSGNDYFYNVTAVKEGSYGVYVGGERLAVLNITNAYTIDTKTVTKSAGQTYQFKVTGPSQPKFQVAGIGDITLASKIGNDYFYKVTVPANLAKGGHGVYVNGTAMAIFTVA